MRKLIIGNWKLNPVTRIEAVRLAKKIDRAPRHEAVLCPPTLFLVSVDYPRLASQDCFWENKGPFTGQVSPLALKKLGVKYCLVGHSEQRNAGETEEQIAKKMEALVSVGIRPVLCVGHGTRVDQDDMEVTDIIKSQLKSALAAVDRAKIVVAYEPVWAISTGRSLGHKHDTPEHAEKIAMFIQNKFAVQKVLYGGSTNSTNAASFLAQRHIAGLLVGGASLLADDFNKIINTSL